MRDAENKVLCVNKAFEVNMLLSYSVLSNLLALVWLRRVVYSKKIPANRQEIPTNRSGRNDRDNLENKLILLKTIYCHCL